MKTHSKLHDFPLFLIVIAAAIGGLAWVKPGFIARHSSYSKVEYISQYSETNGFGNGYLVHVSTQTYAVVRPPEGDPINVSVNDPSARTIISVARRGDVLCLQQYAREKTIVEMTNCES